jgi:hypothetical protein
MVNDLLHNRSKLICIPRYDLHWVVSWSQIVQATPSDGKFIWSQVRRIDYRNQRVAASRSSYLIRTLPSWCRLVKLIFTRVRIRTVPRYNYPIAELEGFGCLQMLSVLFGYAAPALSCNWLAVAIRMYCARVR